MESQRYKKIDKINNKLKNDQSNNRKVFPKFNTYFFTQDMPFQSYTIYH
jgi:hypothetical protein